MFITLFGGVDVLLATADSILVMPFLVEVVKGIRDSISDALYVISSLHVCRQTARKTRAVVVSASDKSDGYCLQCHRSHRRSTYCRVRC